MIKLKLKRKLTGKKLKEFKRTAKKSYIVITENPLWGYKITYKPIPHFKNWDFNHNKPAGKRKYPPALYELNSVSIYQAEKLAQKFKKKKQLGKLKKLYELQPSIDPKIIKEKEHQEAVIKWKTKLKINEHLQNQNKANSY